MLKRWGSGLLPVAAVLLLVGCGGGSPQASGTGRQTTPAPIATPVPIQGTVVSGSRGGISAATLDLSTGSTVLEVESGNLGGDLYQVTSNRGQAAVSTSGSLVQVKGLGGGNDVRILLARGVDWTIDIGAGTSKMWIDLGGATVHDLILGGGAYQASVTLGAPTSPVPVQVTGGMTDLSFGLQQGAGATIRAHNTIDSVHLAGTDRGRVSAGTTLQIGASSTDRYQIDLSSGLYALDVSGG